MDTTADAVVAAAFCDHRESLIRLVAAHARDHDAAADLVDEAYARLVVEARRGRMPESPAAWLYRVARNLLTSQIRHRRVADRFEASHLRRRAVASDAAAAAETRVALRSVAAALPQLRERERDLLLLAASEVTPAEMARITGHSSGATRSALSRSRAALRLAAGIA